MTLGHARAELAVNVRRLPNEVGQARSRWAVRGLRIPRCWLLGCGNNRERTDVCNCEADFLVEEVRDHEKFFLPEQKNRGIRGAACERLAVGSIRRQPISPPGHVEGASHEA